MPIFAISSFGVSFLAMLAMIWLKLAEIKNGKQYLFFNQKSDKFLERNYISLREFFKHWNLRTLRLLYHFFLEKVENFFIRIYKYFRRKFDKPVNMVKGQGNVEKEKTDASFFLKNIEEHKNNHKDK